MSSYLGVFQYQSNPSMFFRRPLLLLAMCLVFVNFTTFQVLESLLLINLDFQCFASANSFRYLSGSLVDCFRNYLIVSICQFFRKNHRFPLSQFLFCLNQTKFENYHLSECGSAKISSICPIKMMRFQDKDSDVDLPTHFVGDIPWESIPQCQLRDFDGLRNQMSQILRCHFLKNCGKFHFYFV